MKILTSLAKGGRALVILAVAILLIAIQGASAAKTRDQVTNEQLLSKNVRHALVTVPWYGVFDNFEYTMNGTEVVLSGQVVARDYGRGSTAASAKGHALSGERGSPRRGDRLHLRSEPADRVADQLGCDHQDQHAHDRGVVLHHPATQLRQHLPGAVAERVVDPKWDPRTERGDRDEDRHHDRLVS